MLSPAGVCRVFGAKSRWFLFPFSMGLSGYGLFGWHTGLASSTPWYVEPPGDTCRRTGVGGRFLALPENLELKALP